MKFAVQIQSYNRWEMLCDLIYSLQEQDPNVPIIIVDDCSRDKKYLTLKDKFDNIHVVRSKTNGAKEMYWRTVNYGLKLTKKLEWDYLIFIADDFYVDDKFYEKMRQHCSKAQVVNFFNSGIQSMWGYRWFVDGAFAASRKVWQMLNFHIPKIPMNRWRKNKHLSSGVWCHVTKVLNSEGIKIKMLNESLADHLGNHQSMMNPAARKTTPLKSATKVKRNKIYNVSLGKIEAKFESVNEEDLIERYWAGGNFYEPDVLAAFALLNLDGDVIIDAGAHRGNHGIFFAKKTKMDVVCFEPFNENYECLVRNIRLNKIDRVMCMNYALGNEEGDVFIENTGSNSGMPKLSASGQKAKQTTIDSSNIDGKVALIKIDTEGNEFPVIEGAEETIKRDIPVLIVETDHPQDVAVVLKAYTKKKYNISRKLGKTPTYIFTPSC